jgi:curved DNA-binding protein
MSSPVSGKFQDHYSILGVEPKADLAAIQAAYAKLTEKYGPDNPETGDAEKLECVSLAFEVLTDPDLRASFNQLKGIDESNAVFSGAVFFDALKFTSDLRVAVLCLLCDRRRTKPFKPSLSIRQIESMLQATSEELDFALWYLKQRAFVINDDKSSLQITVQGMDQLDRDPPVPERVMAVFKPDAIAAKAAPQPASETGAAPEIAATPAIAPAPEVPKPDGSRRGAMLTALSRGRSAKPSSRATAIVQR